MKKKQATPDSGAGKRPVSGCRILCSLLWKLGLAVLLVYGALQILVRTNVFRSRVEAELSRLAGMEMRVGRIRSTESLNLKLTDVISVSEVAGIEARIVRIRWRWFRPQGESMLESLRVDGLALTIAPDKNGVIQPAFLAPLSQVFFKWTGLPLPAVAESATEAVAAKKAGEEWTTASWGDVPLTFQRVSMRWQDAKGNLQAGVSGMDLSWKAMELPNGGRIAHVDCHVAEVKVVNGPRITGLHVELIDTGSRQLLVNLDATDWGSAQKPQAPGAESLELLRSLE